MTVEAPAPKVFCLLQSLWSDFGSRDTDVTLSDCFMIKRAPQAPEKPYGPIIYHWVIYSSSNALDEQYYQQQE